VRELGLPFRDAHHTTGRIVALADKKGVALSELSLADFQSVEPKIGKSVFSVLGVGNSVKSRTSFGGTAPANVRSSAQRWIKRLAKEAASR
jgi:argininosuccinate lyase